MKLLTLAVLLVLATGCSSLKIKDFNKIDVGMTKAQVIDKLGEPDTTHVTDGKEIMEYAAKDENGDKLPRWVVVQDKEVIFYGRPSEWKEQVEKKNAAAGNATVSPQIHTTISPVFSPVFNNGYGGPQSSSDTKPAQVPQQVSQAVVSPQPQGETLTWFHPAAGSPAVEKNETPK